MSLSDNFRRGLSRLQLDAETYAKPIDVDAAISTYLGDDQDGLKETTLRALAGIDTRRRISQLEYGLCGSPIELTFQLALELYATAWTDDEVIHARCYGDGRHHETAAWAPTQLSVCQQHHIGAYRVDFLLTGYEYSADNDGVARVASVVVECDGHDFHERTKEQAKRDRSRDRALQAAGFKVYRFTGSEIHADPFKCAAEAFDAAFGRGGKVK